MSNERESHNEGKVLTRTRTQRKLARPKRYKVLLHNDDYTPRDFVVLLLQAIFHRSESDATQIMLNAHNTGIAVAGVYPFSVAETKVAEVSAAAEKASFPLMCTLEPDDPDGDSGDDSQ